ALTELLVPDVVADAQAQAFGAPGTGRRARRGDGRVDDRATVVATATDGARALVRVHELLGDLREEPARWVVVGGAEQHAAPRVAEIQTFTGARDADITETALFLELVGITEAADVWKHTVFHPGDEHDGELETFGRVQRHQRDRALIAGRAFRGVEVGDERDRFEERLDAVDGERNADRLVGRVSGVGGTHT